MSPSPLPTSLACHWLVRGALSAVYAEQLRISPGISHETRSWTRSTKLQPTTGGSVRRWKTSC